MRQPHQLRRHHVQAGIRQVQLWGAPAAGAQASGRVRGLGLCSRQPLPPRPLQPLAASTKLLCAARPADKPSGALARGGGRASGRARGPPRRTGGCLAVQHDQEERVLTVQRPQRRLKRAAVGLQRLEAAQRPKVLRHAGQTWVQQGGRGRRAKRRWASLAAASWVCMPAYTLQGPVTASRMHATAGWWYACRPRWPHLCSRG